MYGVRTEFVGFARGPPNPTNSVLTPYMIDLLLSALDEGFDKKAWHGTTLRGSLRGLTVGELVWRPGPGRNSIWDIALHAAYWKYVVRRRLVGERRGAFPRRPSNWPAVPDPADAAAWEADLGLLQEQHELLRAAVAALPPERVGDQARRQILGAAFHDVYHAGQIGLVKKLMGTRSARLSGGPR